MEVHRVLIDVLQKELVCGLAVLIKLNLAISIVEIQHGIQRMVIQLFFRRYWLCYGLSQLLTQS